LRHEYVGELFLEVMLVKDLNDTPESLYQLKNKIETIEPDKVFFTTPIRPPSESWVEVPEKKTISLVKDLIPNAVIYDDIESGGIGSNGYSTAEQAIVSICSRHPLRFEQAREIEERFASRNIIKNLIDEGILKRMKYRHHSYLLLDMNHEILPEKYSNANQRIQEEHVT